MVIFVRNRMQCCRAVDAVHCCFHPCPQQVALFSPGAGIGLSNSSPLLSFHSIIRSIHGRVAVSTCKVTPCSILWAAATPNSTRDELMLSVSFIALAMLYDLLKYSTACSYRPCEWECLHNKPPQSGQRKAPETTVFVCFENVVMPESPDTKPSKWTFKVCSQY